MNTVQFNKMMEEKREHRTKIVGTALACAGMRDSPESLPYGLELLWEACDAYEEFSRKMNVKMKQTRTKGPKKERKAIGERKWKR